MACLVPILWSSPPVRYALEAVLDVLVADERAIHAGTYTPAFSLSVRRQWGSGCTPARGIDSKLGHRNAGVL